MIPEETSKPNPPRPPMSDAINLPGLLNFVEADTMGAILEQNGEQAAEYGESLGYLHQLASKIGETLAFDDFRSLHAKNTDFQFYSEKRGDRHFAIEMDANASLSRIKQIITQKA